MAVIVKFLKEKKKRLTFLKDTSLGLALFFNPFGFDAIQYSLISLTGSYWISNAILYSIAGLFFGLYLFFSRHLNKTEKPQ